MSETAGTVGGTRALSHSWFEPQAPGFSRKKKTASVLRPGVPARGAQGEANRGGVAAHRVPLPLGQQIR